MKQTFIEQLTDEQVKAFLDREYPKEENYSYGFDKGENSIYVRMEQNLGDCLFNFTLGEYDTIDCNCSSEWIKYLYEIFGEEYKKSYLDWCAEIFN